MRGSGHLSVFPFKLLSCQSEHTDFKVKFFNHCNVLRPRIMLGGPGMNSGEKFLTRDSWLWAEPVGTTWVAEVLSTPSFPGATVSQLS